MVRCIAIDDEPLALRQIKSYIERTEQLELVATCRSAVDQFLKQTDNTELNENLANGTCNHADSHEVEDRVEQQVVRRVHDSVEHVCRTHLRCQIAEQGKKYHQADNSRRYPPKSFLNEVLYSSHSNYIKYLYYPTTQFLNYAKLYLKSENGNYMERCLIKVWYRNRIGAKKERLILFLK